MPGQCDSCRRDSADVIERAPGQRLCQACDHERRLEALERLIMAMARRGEWKLRCGSTGGKCNARLSEHGPGLRGADCPQYESCMTELTELLLAGAHHG